LLNEATARFTIFDARRRRFVHDRSETSARNRAIAKILLDIGVI
jgi:hypothetical protein